MTDYVRMEEENVLKYVTKSEEWMLHKVLPKGVVIGSVPRVVVPQVGVPEAEVPQAVRPARPTRPTYMARAMNGWIGLWRSHCMGIFSKAWEKRT